MKLAGTASSKQRRVQRVAESASRVLAIGLGAALNVAGWMVVFSGPWRMGFWIVVLSAGIVSIILWDASAGRN